jgi:hypothetical protein
MKTVGAPDPARIANTRDYRRSGERADAWNSLKALTLRGFSVPSLYLPVDTLYLGIELEKVLVKPPEKLPSAIRDAIFCVIQELWDLVVGRNPLGINDTELHKQPADLVDLGGSLSDEPLTHAMHHEHRLLLQVFRVYKAHVRARNGLADRLSIVRVVLVDLYIGLYQLWRDQLNGVAQCLQLPSKVV